MTTIWPQEPYRRRFVYLLDPYDIERAHYASDSAARDFLEQDDATLVAWPPEADLPEQLREVVRNNTLNRGDILALSPIDRDEYLLVEHVADVTALRKVDVFVRLCQKLGATEVRVLVARDLKSGVETEVGIKGKRLKVGAAGSVTSTALSALASSISVNDVFDGGQPDIVGATELLARHGLSTDPQMRGLVETRADAANVHRSRKITLNLTQESKRLLEAGASVSVPVVFNVNTSFKRAVDKLEDLRVEYVVEFGHGKPTGNRLA